MNNILNSLYNGKITPWERKTQFTEEQRKLLQKLDQEHRYFTEKLSAEDCDRFENFIDLHGKLLSDEEENAFSYGFSLGLLLTLDITEQAKLIINE